MVAMIKAHSTALLRGNGHPPSPMKGSRWLDCWQPDRVAETAYIGQAIIEWPPCSRVIDCHLDDQKALYTGFDKH